MEYFREDRYFLEKATMKAKELLMEMGKKELMKADWEHIRLVLPCATSKTGRKIWSSGGSSCERWPEVLRPLSTEQEKEYVSSLIEDIRRRLALDLEPHPICERMVGSQSRPKHRVNYMVVGGSNARRLGKALAEAGHSVSMVIKVGWTINRENCGSMATEMATTIKDEDPVVVVLFLLDGSCFYTRSTDGGRVLPKRMEDGNIHVNGDLVVASREVQTEHFNALKPMLDAIGKRQCLIVSPMQRYIVGGCCQDVRHVANWLDRGYQEQQKQQLSLLTRNLKAFLYNSRRANVRVVDVAQDLAGFDNADIWCVDPIHPIDSVYRRIAAGVLKMAMNMHEHEERAGTKRRREGPDQADQHTRRPRDDNASHGMQEYREDYRDRGQRPREYDYSRSGRDEQPRHEQRYDQRYEQEHERGDRVREYRGGSYFRGGYNPYRGRYHGGRRPY
jgi:hypothetical protein